MKAVAALEALSFNFTEEQLRMFDINPYVELFGPMFVPESIKAMVQMFRQYAEPELKDKIDKFEEVHTPSLIHATTCFSTFLR